MMATQTDVRELRVRVGKETLRELRILAAEEDVSLAALARGLLSGSLALVKGARLGEAGGTMPAGSDPTLLPAAKVFTASLLRAIHALDEAEAAYGAPLPDAGTPPDLQEKLTAYRRRGEPGVTIASDPE